MNSPATQTMPIGWIIAAAAAAAAAAVFAFDVLLPLGYSVPMLYVLPVMITRYAPGWWSTGLMTGVAVALTWMGMALSTGEFTRQVGVTRAMASVLLLLVAGLVFKQKHMAQQRDADQEALRESEMRFRTLGPVNTTESVYAILRTWNSPTPSIVKSNAVCRHHAAT